jgi:hypothetical protein
VDPEISVTGRDLVAGIGSESEVVDRAVMVHFGVKISALERQAVKKMPRCAEFSSVLVEVRQ